MRFYDRNIELERLKKASNLARNSAQMTTIIGRRRVGKTELAVKFLEDVKDGVYFFVSRKKIFSLVSEFGDGLRHINPSVIGETSSMDEFLKILFETAMAKPIVVVFDEFQNFKYVDSSVFSIFQKFWDEYHKKAKIHLVFIGSMISMMEKIFSGRKEPLFGRATMRIEIPPLSPGTLTLILKDWNCLSPSRLLDFFTVFGGTPKYYSIVDSYKFTASPIEEILGELVLNKSGILYKEVYDILIEEFGKKYQTYFTILQAIASSKNTISEIANACGMAVNVTSKYMDELLNYYKIIERWVPFGSKKATSRMGLYFISDEFIKFWFRYVYRYESLIELKRDRDVLEYVKADFNNLRGMAFEKLVKETLIEINSRNAFPFQFEKIGRYWDRKGETEIDVLLQNGNELLFGECKLSSRAIKDSSINKFMEKASLVGKTLKPKAARHAFFTLDQPDADIRKRLLSKGIYIYSLEDLFAL